VDKEVLQLVAQVLDSCLHTTLMELRCTEPQNVQLERSKSNISLKPIHKREGKMETYMRRTVVLAVAAASLLLTGSAGAQTVSMQFDDITSQATGSVPSQTLPDGYTWTAGQYGVYSFDVQSVTGGTIPGLTAGTTFWSTCLSPGGELDGGYYSYNYEPFSAEGVGNGINPPAWTSGTVNGQTQYWGIQNASYMWNYWATATSGLKSSALHGLDAPDAGAALEIAMYVALYDSTGYGAYTETKFVPAASGPNAFSSGMLAAINDDLAVLDPTTVSNNLSAGFVLVPTNPNSSGPSGQEFIFFSPDMNNVSAPEPMATSMLGGLIALFAVTGGSVFRKFSSRAKPGFRQ
jgi:hypothetical protein